MSYEGYSKSAITHALQTYISFKIVNLLLAFIFQIAVAKILSPAHFATYAILMATLMAGERALSFGIDRTILRFVPTLSRNGDVAGLRILISRIVLMRLVGVITFIVAGVFGAQLLNSILPIPLDQGSLWTFGLWFMAYTFTNDADAFAQSWLAHFQSALAALLEIAARMSVLLLLIGYRTVGVVDIVTICASTSTIALFWVGFRLRKHLYPLVKRTATATPQGGDATFDPKRGPVFALANFASTISYLISSPPVIRIMATAGLDVIALAAFSFAQGLYISLQRAFPGLLILPALEPIIMSQLAGDMRGHGAYSGLSLLFKVELVCILSVVIVTAIAGADVVEILSRAAYAPYYYVLPILVASLVLITSYRLMELIVNTNYKQHIFFWLWPLSALAMLAMYTTVPTWGLVSVLVWPIVEIALRIALLTFLLRRYAVWRAFDPSRSTLLIFSAFAITICLFVLRGVAPMHFHYSDLILAAAGLTCFLASILILRPLRPPEYEVLVAALPAALKVVQRLAFRATRRESIT